jgi:ABC-type polysaccharide/polyol phosphate export permease
MFSSYAIILAVTVLGWLVTFHLFSRFRKRIAFWV